MNTLIGWICIFTSVVFCGSVWLGLETDVKTGVVFFTAVEISLTLLAFGVHLLNIGD